MGTLTNRLTAGLAVGVIALPLAACGASTPTSDVTSESSVTTTVATTTTAATAPTATSATTTSAAASSDIEGTVVTAQGLSFLVPAGFEENPDYTTNAFYEFEYTLPGDSGAGIRRIITSGVIRGVDSIELAFNSQDYLMPQLLSGYAETGLDEMSLGSMTVRRVAFTYSSNAAPGVTWYLEEDGQVAVVTLLLDEPDDALVAALEESFAFTG